MYDTVRILASAMKQAGNDPTALRAALRKVRDFPGVMGPITFDQDGVASFPLTRYRIEGGKAVPFQ